MNKNYLINKICIHVGGRTIEEFLNELNKAQSLCSFIELRIDYIEDLNEKHLEKIYSMLACNAILTCRSIENGGFFRDTEERRLQLLDYASNIGFNLIDIELSTAISEEKFVSRIKQKTDIIISYHNFNQTPDVTKLYSFYLAMNKYDPHLCKIATMVNSDIEAFALLNLLSKVALEGKAIVVGMGVLGRTIRLLAPILGSNVAYSVFSGSIVQVPGAVDMNDFISFFQEYSKII